MGRFFSGAAGVGFTCGDLALAGREFLVLQRLSFRDVSLLGQSPLLLRAGHVFLGRAMRFARVLLGLGHLLLCRALRLPRVRLGFGDGALGVSHGPLRSAFGLRDALPHVALRIVLVRLGFALQLRDLIACADLLALESIAPHGRLFKDLPLALHLLADSAIAIIRIATILIDALAGSAPSAGFKFGRQSNRQVVHSCFAQMRDRLLEVADALFILLRSAARPRSGMVA